MPLYVRPATEADSWRIGCIGKDAFRDTISRVLFPPHLHSKSETGDPGLDEVQWRAARNTRRMRDGKATFVVVDAPDDGGAEENVVGFVQWELPPPQDAPEVRVEVSEADQDPLPASLDEEGLRAIIETLEAQTEKALGPDGHSKLWCKFVTRPRKPS